MSNLPSSAVAAVHLSTLSHLSLPLYGDLSGRRRPTAYFWTEVLAVAQLTVSVIAAHKQLRLLYKASIQSISISTINIPFLFIPSITSCLTFSRTWNHFLVQHLYISHQTQHNMYPFSHLPGPESQQEPTNSLSPCRDMQMSTTEQATAMARPSM